MNGLHTEQLEFWTRIASSTGTLIIAIVVAYIAWLQWKTSREKLRLDLYAKRFDVYIRTFDFYTELLMWENRPEQEALITPFKRAFLESKFLFSESSGIHGFLKEFDLHAFAITQYMKSYALLETLPNERTKLVKARAEHVTWILYSIPNLNGRIASFLNFHTV